jgi:hypothetical protein
MQPFFFINKIMRKHELKPKQIEFQEMFGNFLKIVIKVLNLSSLPKFHFEAFLDHPQQPTFGMYVNGENKLYVGLSGRHPNDIFRTIAHELTHYKQDIEQMLDNRSGETGSPIENQANAMAGIIMRMFNKQYPNYLRSKPVMEKWSQKYKKSINCSNPKGFSQRAHCQGRKKHEEDIEENFADGRNPKDKGDSDRHGIKKGITIAQLKKIRSSDSASRRKKQLAHWQINMRQGRNKKGE